MYVEQIVYVSSQKLSGWVLCPKATAQEAGKGRNKPICPREGGYASAFLARVACIFVAIKPIVPPAEERGEHPTRVHHGWHGHANFNNNQLARVASLVGNRQFATHWIDQKLLTKTLYMYMYCTLHCTTVLLIVPVRRTASSYY